MCLADSPNRTGVKTANKREGRIRGNGLIAILFALAAVLDVVVVTHFTYLLLSFSSTYFNSGI